MAKKDDAKQDKVDESASDVAEVKASPEDPKAIELVAIELNPLVKLHEYKAANGKTYRPGDVLQRSEFEEILKNAKVEGEKAFTARKVVS